MPLYAQHQLLSFISFQRLEKIMLKNCFWLTVGAIEILAFHFPETIKVSYK